MRRPVKLRRPTGVGITTLTTGRRVDRGHLFVDAATKPPKLRYQPGSFVEYTDSRDEEGKGVYEILYAYRLAEDPHEWIYTLSKRQGLTALPRDPISRLAVALGAGATTPRVVYELFRSGYEALTYFNDIVTGGDTICVRNKELMQRGKLISSGEII